METNKVLIGIGVAIVLAVLVIQTFQISSIKKVLSGATGSASDRIDMGGWTENEIMNYEMHGTIPSRISGGASSGNGMVGGC